MLTEVREGQFLKANQSSFSIPALIVILLTVLEESASVPMAFTLYPSITEGMIMFSSLLVTAVIVARPFTSVYLELVV